MHRVSLGQWKEILWNLIAHRWLSCPLAARSFRHTPPGRLRQLKTPPTQMLPTLTLVSTPIRAIMFRNRPVVVLRHRAMVLRLNVLL